MDIDIYLEIIDNKLVAFHMWKSNQNLYMHKNT